ncbi:MULTISPECIES: ABC transporter ATP-binding protein [Glutamicibacter]|uniref:ABC transporter ATP-binding protein n=1 Tax=Glutamicibacter TaxID=1742989 RepID=UPI000FFB0762|nr:MULTISPECIES: ABC transporter ATP-binding protein [Glutamicibacter]QEP08607.1 ABC transporter ATP-binding protein [Glutamicibacter sp. ZJUTW]RWZ83110.1 ABC transporter ATP-binding protein [Glutamicibacter sp. HZAU]WIV43891.1 ABC transporter ATP-binding protein [Glutamicibacter nicotianae]
MTNQQSNVRLEVNQVQKIYKLSSGNEFEAVRSLTFDLHEGEFVCLVGPSGSGKTTLLKCIAGLMNATSGTVVLDGKPVNGPAKGMAVVFQEYGRSLFPWMTVEANVDLPLKTSGVAKGERARRVKDALESVGLEKAGKKYPWQLSGGMQQRVAIARAVAAQPSVLLMDEPFAAVDAQTRAELEDLVRRIWKQHNMTILFVTHDIDESVYLAERVLVLSSSPTVIQNDIKIDLPVDRNQLTTRSEARFGELRSEVYEQVQRAKTNTDGQSDVLRVKEPAA